MEGNAISKTRFLYHVGTYNNFGCLSYNAKFSLIVLNAGKVRFLTSNCMEAILLLIRHFG